MRAFALIALFVTTAQGQSVNVGTNVVRGDLVQPNALPRATPYGFPPAATFDKHYIKQLPPLDKNSFENRFERSKRIAFARKRRDEIWRDEKHLHTRLSQHFGVNSALAPCMIGLFVGVVVIFGILRFRHGARASIEEPFLRM